jgi:hypothetical protein
MCWDEEQGTARDGPWILLYLYPFFMGTDGQHKKEEEASGRRTEKVDAGKV